MALPEQITDQYRPDITLIPLTIDYARSMFKLISSNQEFLSQHGEQTGSKYNSVEQFAQSIENPRNSHRERYSILTHGILAGSINLTPLNESGSVMEVGYWVGEEFARQGIASNSARMLSDQALERKDVEKVFGFTHPENHSSRKTGL